MEFEKFIGKGTVGVFLSYKLPVPLTWDDPLMCKLGSEFLLKIRQRY